MPRTVVTGSRFPAYPTGAPPCLQVSLTHRHQLALELDGTASYDLVVVSDGRPLQRAALAQLAGADDAVPPALAAGQEDAGVQVPDDAAGTQRGGKTSPAASRLLRLLQRRVALPEVVLEGPLELNVSAAAASGLSLRLPHAVDAGAVRRIVLQPGVAVAVRGAGAVELAAPLSLARLPPSYLAEAVALQLTGEAEPGYEQVRLAPVTQRWSAHVCMMPA